MEEKVFSFGKISAIATDGQRESPHFGLLIILVLEHHATTRKPTMMQKGIITINPSCLTTSYLHQQYIEVFTYRKFSGSSFEHQI